MENKYRIKEVVYIDKTEAKEVNQFFVQEKVWLFWKTLSELFPCGDGCVSSQPKIFNSYGEAEAHIKKLRSISGRSFTRYFTPK